MALAIMRRRHQSLLFGPAASGAADADDDDVAIAPPSYLSPNVRVVQDGDRQRELFASSWLALHGSQSTGQ